jgi:uncharacterized protein YjaZ
MPTFGARRVTAMLLVALSACEPHFVDVQVASEDPAFLRDERRTLQGIADAAAREIHVHLPSLPKKVTLVVQPGKDVIAETGETGTAVLPASVYWTVDPARDVPSIVRKELRPTLFHELHHLARDARVPRVSLMDSVVSEGMATAFERDFGNVNPPWAAAPPEVMEWTRELLALPDDAPRNVWLHRHPDGRRWIGLRVGTFLVDRAMKASGRSSAELVATPTAEILEMAGVRREK